MNIHSFIVNGDPAVLLEAIISVREDFERDIQLGKKAHSDDWVTHSYYNDYLLKCVRDKWAGYAKEPHFRCPFTDDVIGAMWINTRKNKYGLRRLDVDVKERKEHELFFPCEKAIA